MEQQQRKQRRPDPIDQAVQRRILIDKNLSSGKNEWDKDPFILVMLITFVILFSSASPFVFTVAFILYLAWLSSFLN